VGGGIGAELGNRVTTQRSVHLMARPRSYHNLGLERRRVVGEEGGVGGGIVIVIKKSKTLSGSPDQGTKHKRGRLTGDEKV